MFEYNCVLDRVIDGDTVDATIDLGFDVTIHKRIRLYGIDAPETRTRDKQEKQAGLLTKARLIEILEHNNNRFVLQSVDVGKFGRCIGILSVPQHDTSVNNVLINEHLARPYDE